MSAREKETTVGETKARAAAAAGSGLSGLTFRRVYTDGVTPPFDAVEWELRTAAITNEKGEVFFEQKDVEVPKVVVDDGDEHRRAEVLSRESRDAAARALGPAARRRASSTRSPAGAGRTATSGPPPTATSFPTSSTYLLVNQAASFNSPVWFNVGVEAKPQASACFINAVGDSMGSILDLAKTEGMLFKFGSGTGSNLSSLRSSTESLSSGGIASGPVSFMKGFDSFAGAIKSGGKTRRAAKMVILNVDHPDIEEFIDCKEKEETKGLGPHRGGLGRLLRRRGLQPARLPEREPLRARDGRLHAGRRNGRQCT